MKIENRKVAPEGIEPTPEVPETSVLSIKLWSQKLKCKANFFLPVFKPFSFLSIQYPKIPVLDNLLNLKKLKS